MKRYYPPEVRAAVTELLISRERHQVSTEYIYTYFCFCLLSQVDACCQAKYCTDPWNAK